MNTNTTVASVRTYMGDQFSSADFLSLLNQALLRMNDEGLWRGVVISTTFNSSQGFITLPYPYLSVLKGRWWKCPVPTFTEFHDFLESGPGGWLDDTKPPAGIFVSKSDGFCTQLDPPTPGSTYKVVPDLLIDNGKVFRFYLVSNGQPVFDVNGEGMNVTVNFPSTSVATVADYFTGIQVPTNADGSSAMIGPWNLYSVSPTGVNTLIGRYYPPETTPSYQRYYTGTTDKSITVLCRRRFIQVKHDTDWCIPGNLGAIKAAMKAIVNEDSTNYSEAQPLWASCYNILNKEAHAERGGAKPELDLQFLGGGAGFTNVT